MKALFIWNDSSKGFLVDSLLKTKQFSDIVEENRIKEGYLLCSKEDWSEHHNNIKEVQYIYILVELDWDNDLFQGYQIGLEVLKKWKGQNPPTLQFVSAMSRESLFDNVEGKDQYLVKVFNHLDLLEIQDKKFPTFRIDKDEWNFYKNYALTGAGILDDFIHRLDPMISLEVNKSELSKIIHQMKNQSGIVGAETMKYLSSFQDQNTDLKGFAIELRQLIEERKLIYKHHKLESIDISRYLKVMIVEDNEQHLDILSTSLSRYFSEDQIHCFSNGKEALKAYEENPKEYNLVFLDLELLESNFYQPVQGLHILKKIDQKKMSSFTVITGLGRKGVQELLQLTPKKIVSKKQLYQYDTDKEVDNMLERMVQEYKVLEQKQLVNFGPKKSYFMWEGFPTAFSEYYSQKHHKNRFWTEAYKVLEKFKNRELNICDWPNMSKDLPAPRRRGNTNPEVFMDKKLSTLLAHRLIVIYLASLDNLNLYCNNDRYVDYTRTLNENEIILNKGHLDRISLSITTVDTITEQDTKYIKYKIEKRRLFPEEIKFIFELEKKKNVSFGDILLRENSPDLLYVFSKDLDLGEEKTQKLMVEGPISEWTILDLISVINIMFEDVLKEEKDSQWYDIVQRLLDSDLFTRSIELELEKYIPSVIDQIGRIHDVFIKDLDESI